MCRARKMATKAALEKTNERKKPEEKVSKFPKCMLTLLHVVVVFIVPVWFVLVCVCVFFFYFYFLGRARLFTVFMLK